MAAPATDLSPKTSTTEAGHYKGAHEQREHVQPNSEHVDAINQVFALFRINYHNQFHAAFSDTQLLNQAKRLWCESLAYFDPNTILLGAKATIEQSDYLLTLHKMISMCQGTPELHGLPNVHSAYLEACQAPSPKASYSWSHPAVYHAGRSSDWFFLANNPERQTFAVFKEHYLRFCEQVVKGVELAQPKRPALADGTATPLSKSENIDRLQAMRQQLDL